MMVQGGIDFEDFLLVMREKSKEVDMEIHFKDAFRVFSKDEEGEFDLFVPHHHLHHQDVSQQKS